GERLRVASAATHVGLSLNHRKFLGLLTGLLLGADAPTDDLARLQGTWTTIRFESEGIPATTIGDKLVIRGERFHTSGTLIVEGTIRYDPSSPTTYEKETHRVGGKESRKRYIGLCALEGDRLRECLALPGAEPPTDLSNAGGGRRIADVWKRTERSEIGIVGSWTLVERVAIGKRQSKGQIEGITMTIHTPTAPGEYRYVLRNKYEGRGRISIDPKSTPKKIDLIGDDGLANERQSGIYKIQDGQFFNSFSVTDRSRRPADFTTKPGDFRWLTVYGRERTKGLASYATDKK
ncbi:hypothetical protein ACYOEI_33145, partial [Singulisphaera rosea]